ncbi:DUF1338 domain-containing protein [Pinibacter aurantiacus]|uniref:2-oxoadipate dioxygenase/decarboxylase n=1 Tax=Pinibacter aurantiacus TaxID=2851599 RepID=A0A9E2S9I9_9BACT|nr:DUF1338 domain-containing protein [Pinibacter aurantiacus]MBV4358896.1 DUF1338 domain-containing protein [Pinibacter aurantiacus]
MQFNNQNPLAYFLTDLFEQYRRSVPDVNAITQALEDKGVISSQSEIVNDHIAFRTLGVPHLGIKSFEKIFLHHGYTRMENYFFAEKKLNAWWYAPPSPEYPRVFLSELIVEQLSTSAQKIIHSYIDSIKADPVDSLDLNDGKQIAAFLYQSLWELPTLKDYAMLLNESEYAAWVIYNRYYLNHYTISVHDLKEGYNTLETFNAFVESLGIRLNDSGGKIKVSKDKLLRQSATVAQKIHSQFADGESMLIAGSYVEFAERNILPQFNSLPPEQIKREHRREGFETSNADKIFESTYTTQTK